MSAAFSALLGIQSFSRFSTYHNRTYDLALYARQAWGLAHGNFWDPIVDAHFLGTHMAFVLWPLGVLGKTFGVVPVLLSAQALAIGLATLPLAHIGARRFGDVGALCAAALWFAYPNISHVASYEFHPGTLAVLPMAMLLDACDRRHGFGFALGVLGLLVCRADFACVTLLLSAAVLWQERRAQRQEAFRWVAAGVAVLSLAYLGAQWLYLRPRYWAAVTSFDLHFARWGGSPLGIVTTLFHAPRSVLAHALETKRLLYLPTVLWPLGFLPALAPRFLIATLPFLASNLISTFPTTLELYSHYLTPAVPALVAGSLEGLAVVLSSERFVVTPIFGQLWLLGFALSANVRSGSYPWSHGFEASAFHYDAQSAQAARIVAVVDPHASVQAPDALLPHLAARPQVQRAPPPDRQADFVILDVTHRVRYNRREDLLRTSEEPLVRDWLSRRGYGLVQAERNYVVFERGSDPRAGPAARYLSGQPALAYGTPLTRCLSVLSAWLDPQGLELELAARAPCPADLALRIEIEGRSSRVDLLFDGLLSPALLRDEQVFSWHPLSDDERRAILEHGLSLGALRSSGAPPEYGDPIGQPIAVIH
jgi:uncharacterized membrane protein